LDVIQSDVGVDRGLDISVSKEAANELVLARALCQDQRTSGVPELVHRHAGMIEVFGEALYLSRITIVNRKAA
jgi:hypothetical protein